MAGTVDKIFIPYFRLVSPYRHLFDDSFLLRLSVEIKPEICKLFENLFRPFHMKEHVRIIDENKKLGPAHVICVGGIRFEFFDTRIFRKMKELALGRNKTGNL